MTSPLTTVGAVLAWYGSNIGVLIFNKFLLSNSGFRFPVFLSFCHMLACAILGIAFSASKIFPANPLKSRRQLLEIAVLAGIFCTTIVLGNASLRYLPVSFTQAVGSSTPFFTAIFSFFMQGIREAPSTYAALIPIAGGVVIASGGEPLFHLLGFIFCLAATAGRALKSVVQALLMSDPQAKMDPMSLLLYMSSISVLLLLPTAMIWEPEAISRLLEIQARRPGFIWALAGNSVMAYAVNLTNFMVTKYTSALTLQVLGNAKGVVAAAISLAIFHNPVTYKGAVGYAVTIGGVVLYSESKKQSRRAAEARSLKEDQAEAAKPGQAGLGAAEALSDIKVVTLDYSSPNKVV